MEAVITDTTIETSSLENLVIVTAPPKTSESPRKALSAVENAEVFVYPKKARNNNTHTRKRKSRSTSTKAKQPSAVGIIGEAPRTNNQHPSHSLLENNGFEQHTYDKFRLRCLKG
jgi:hypothetical protein